MRIRFSLRFSLVIFTMIAIVFGASAHFVYREKEKVRRHKAAVKKLHEKGIEFRTYPLAEPHIEGESAFRRFVRVNVDRDAYPYVGQVTLGSLVQASLPISPLEALDDLQDVQCVKELVLREKQLSKGIADRLIRLPDVRSLSLQFESIDREAARKLYEMDQMEVLHLDPWRRLPDLRACGGIDDESMRAIARHPGLKELRVYAARLSDVGMAAIGEMKSVVTLELLSPKQVTDSFCRDLGKLPQLASLVIYGGTPLTTEQLRLLQGCQKLEYLSLAETTVREADLRLFEDHPTLREFTFVGDLPEEAIKRFLKKRKRRVIQQRIKPNSGEGMLYTMDGDDLYCHDLSAAY